MRTGPIVRTIVLHGVISSGEEGVSRDTPRPGFHFSPLSCLHQTAMGDCRDDIGWQQTHRQMNTPSSSLGVKTEGGALLKSLRAKACSQHT